MFSRRRGSSAARKPVDSNTSANAAAAASQAFLRKSNSNASLSSAAAAAALRSLTSSPEPVGNVVTKRMARRGSVSSVGSGSVVGGSTRGGSVRPGLQRQNSSGSMTERTFRSPSPGRQNGGQNGAVPASRDAPPVPAIPTRVPSAHQRSSSVEPPARVVSPTPRRGGRNMSVDRANLPPPVTRGSGKRLSDVHEELHRTDSNRSVNFSRPRASQPSSPVSPTMGAKQFTHGTGAWFSEPTGAAARSTTQRNVNESKIARIQAAAQQAMGGSSAPQRPSAQTNTSYEGPPSLSYQSTDAVMVYDPNSRTFINKPRPKPKQTQPPAPALPAAPALAPGSYDPSTRSFVPVSPATSQKASPVTTPMVEKKRPEMPTVDTQLQPPPRNPARLSPTSSPTFTRPTLATVPSTVREGDAAEQKAATETTATEPTLSTPQTGATATAVPQDASRLKTTPDRAARGRNLSSSPSPHRAHFSQSPVIENHRHAPPGRDISPAKSALKHSPAPSLRASSPLAFSSSVVKSPPSEVSDTSDLGYQDGLAAKRKKAVRVSFEEQPVQIEPIPAVTARALSPHLQDNDDDDEIMAPRPALPSFGSVRRERGSAAETEKPVTTPVTTLGTSSDHAIGGILKTTRDPLAPEVTSKESAGYVSDESEDLSSPVASSTPAQAVNALGTEQNSDSVTTSVKEVTQTSPDPLENEDNEVPAINLLPPTPGTEEDGKTLGHAADEADSEIVNGDVEEDDDLTGNIITEDGFSSYASPALLEAIDEDSDDSGQFSDAAEDLSELDNGGYASLNAIAVSPVHTATAAKATSPAPVPASPPESPSVKQAAKKAETPEVVDDNDKRSTGDWTEATAYWSRLSKQQRDQIEREHIPSDDEESVPSPVIPSKLIKKTLPPAAAVMPAATAASPTQQTTPVKTPKSVQPPAAAQPVKSAMKKSLRDPPQAAPAEREVGMRKSMRDGGSMATTSLRNGSAQRPQSAIVEKQSTAPPKTSRPVSVTAPVSTMAQAAASQQRQQQEPKTLRAEPKKAAPPAPIVSRRLQKELAKADDSDSDSSFRKKRRNGASADSGRYSMRRSMRGGPADRGPVIEERPISPTPARGKRALSIRSLSPTGSFLSRNKGEKLRESLRGNDSSSRLTLRGTQNSKSKSKPANAGRPSTASGASTSRFRSRFVDSDDEDDGAQGRGFFRSRFADSDDEDDGRFIAADLTPVRGIPRTAAYNDDSTDLEDEDDDVGPNKTSKKGGKKSMPMVPDPADVERAMEAARKKLGITENNTTAPSEPTESKQGTTLNRGSLRVRSNSDMPTTRPPVEEPVPVPVPAPVPASVNGDTPTKRRSFMGGFLRRNRASTASVPTINYGRTSAIPPSSIPGTTDTAAEATSSPVQLHSSKPARLVRGDSNYSNATAPPMMGDRNENWPLAPPVPDLPSGVLRNGSASYGAARPQTSDGSPHKGRQAGSVRFDDSASETKGIYSNRTGKKKRFGMIRRAFRLDD